jgi:hypothetical protein
MILHSIFCFFYRFLFPRIYMYTQFRFKNEAIYTVRSNKKKNGVGENGGSNQSKHQNSTIQVTRFFFN